MKDMQLCPTISNLKTLVLDGWVVASEVHALICFFRHEPILEKISLGLCEEREYIAEIKESCGLLEPLLPLEHLKIIEVSCSRGSDGFGRVHKLVKLHNACGATWERRSELRHRFPLASAWGQAVCEDVTVLLGHSQWLELVASSN